MQVTNDVANYLMVHVNEVAQNYESESNSN